MPEATRSEIVKTRVKPHESDAIREVADQLGKTIAELVREATLDAVRRVRKDDSPEPPLGEWRSGVVERNA